jgi:hypothetical protein
MRTVYSVGGKEIVLTISLILMLILGTTEKLFLYKLHLFDLVVDLSSSSGSAVAYTSPKESHPRLSTVKKVGTEYTLEASEPCMTDHRRYFALMQQLARYQRRQDWMQKRLVEEISEAEANRDGGGDARTLEDPDQCRDGGGGSGRRQASRTSSTTGGLNMSDTLGMMLTGGWWWWYGSDDSEAEDYEPLISNKSVSGQGQGIAQDGEDQRGRNGVRIQVLQMQTSGSLSTEAIR